MRSLATKNERYIENGFHTFVDSDFFLILFSLFMKRKKLRCEIGNENDILRSSIRYTKFLVYIMAD